MSSKAALLCECVNQSRLSLYLNRDVKDILIICADGLTGIKDAIEAAFPRLNIRGAEPVLLYRT